MSDVSCKQKTDLKSYFKAKTKMGRKGNKAVRSLEYLLNVDAMLV